MKTTMVYVISSALAVWDSGKTLLNQKYYWHIHHGHLVELQTEPIQNRIDSIKAEKPENQIPTRLRLLRKVKDQKAVKAAIAVRDKAVKAANAVYDKAVNAAKADYDKAVKAANA